MFDMCDGQCSQFNDSIPKLDFSMSPYSRVLMVVVLVPQMGQFSPLVTLGVW